ncbi:NAD(P)H dehydrogenase (quinone) [Sarracenia purpurea var. burkii]
MERFNTWINRSALRPTRHTDEGAAEGRRGLEISSVAGLVDDDEILFGPPTRYGCMVSQRKAFYDSVGLQGSPLVSFGGYWPSRRQPRNHRPRTKPPLEDQLSLSQGLLGDGLLGVNCSGTPINCSGILNSCSGTLSCRSEIPG